MLEAYKLIQNLEDQHWKAIKLEDIKNVIAACAGLYLEAVAETNQATANSSINLKIESINRSDYQITLNSYAINTLDVVKNIELKNNISYDFKDVLKIDSKQQPTTPYWLTKKGSLGMYTVDDKNLIGQPETPRNQLVTFNLTFGKTSISYSKPIVYKTNDDVKGEVYKPFEIIPEASAKVAEDVIIFENDKQKDIVCLLYTSPSPRD